MHTQEELIDCYAENYDVLVTFALHVVHNKQLAEELVQDMVMKIVVHPDSFIKADTIMAYFKTCIVNAAKTLSNRERKFVITDPALVEIQRNDHSVNHSRDIDMAIDLQRILSKCSPREKQLLELRYVFGYKLNEIADIFGTNVNAVSQQLFRIRTRLAKILEKEDLMILTLLLCFYYQGN